MLMVSYHFPPIAGVGVQRTLKHVTYLPEAGWTPSVIAPRGAVYRLMDHTSVAALPRDLELHRSFCYEPARLRRQAARAMRFLRGTSPSSGPGGGGPGGGSASPLNAAWSSSVRFLFFPDEQLLWIPFAVRSAVRAHRDRPVAALYSTSPPVSSHLIAGLVKGMTRLPWIADFRDPWIGNSYAAPLPRLHRYLQARLERWIVHRADRVVFASAGLRRRYAERYPSLAHRFVVIPNGYDPAEMQLVAPARPDAESTGTAVVRLVYTGSVYGEDELPIFAAGLELALERRPELRDRLRVEFIGWMTDANARLVDQLRPRLGDVVSRTGFLPREIALARLQAADAGLVLIAAGPGRDVVVTGKLFEYIGLSKQILAMVPPGDARELLNDLHWGIVADPEPESVAQALHCLVDAPAPRGQADPVGTYDRRRLAGRLGALLDEVVED